MRSNRSMNRPASLSTSEDEDEGEVLPAGLDRERRRGYMGLTKPPDLEHFGLGSENFENSAVISSASMGNGVTVAQQTLTLFV